MFKKIAKVVTGLLVGCVLTLGVKSTVQAAVVYYINGNGAYAVDEETRFTALMPSGSVIPAGSTVFIDKSGYESLDPACAFRPTGWFSTKFTTVANTVIDYNCDGKISVGYTLAPGYTGEHALLAKSWDYKINGLATQASVLSNLYANNICSPVITNVAPICIPQLQIPQIPQLQVPQIQVPQLQVQVPQLSIPELPAMDFNF